MVTSSPGATPGTCVIALTTELTIGGGGCVNVSTHFKLPTLACEGGVGTNVITALFTAGHPSLNASGELRAIPPEATTAIVAGVTLLIASADNPIAILPLTPSGKCTANGIWLPSEA